MPSKQTTPTVGDLNSAARGSGARFNSGKVEYHQFPLEAIEGTLRVLMYGAKKYAPGNYLKGQPWTVPFNSLMRHMAAWQRGELLDPESNLPHLDHAMCNLMFLSIYRDVYPEGDDRWPQMRRGGVPPEPPNEHDTGRKGQAGSKRSSAKPRRVLAYARAKRHGRSKP